MPSTNSDLKKTNQHIKAPYGNASSNYVSDYSDDSLQKNLPQSNSYHGKSINSSIKKERTEESDVFESRFSPDLQISEIELKIATLNKQILFQEEIINIPYIDDNEKRLKIVSEEEKEKEKLEKEKEELLGQITKIKKRSQEVMYSIPEGDEGSDSIPEGDEESDSIPEGNEEYDK